MGNLWEGRKRGIMEGLGLRVGPGSRGSLARGRPVEKGHKGT